MFPFSFVSYFRNYPFVLFCPGEIVANTPPASGIFHQDTFFQKIGHIAFDCFAAHLRHTSVFPVCETSLEAARSHVKKAVDHLLLPLVQRNPALPVPEP